MTALAPAELAGLQSRVLDAVLSGTALEPDGAPIQFPDLVFLRRHPVVYVLDENLGGALDTHEDVRVVPTAELHEAAREQGDIGYFHFRPADLADRTVRLTLEGKLMSAQSDRALGLSSIQVTFEQANGQWHAAGAPTLFAA
jgi:hypothetical protein